MARKYFSLEKNKQTATLNIYGDITSCPWFEGDTSAAALSKQLEALGDVSQIDVFINSYGGEVAEGLAIYNALKRHKANVTTYCDGFACSIASVIFMAGNKRVMNDASLLMIHNAWTVAQGNAAELRKQAEDLDKITQASFKAYKANSSLTEEEIKELMDKETWISPEEAVEYGFATSIDKTESSKAKQNAFMKLFEMIMAQQAEEPEDEETEGESPDEAPDDEQTEEEVAEAETPEDEETEGETETEETDGEAEEPEEPSDEEPEEAEVEEPTDEETEETTEEDSEEDKDENVSQKWAGFFNAIMKM